jgi:hypothetical protein
MSASPDSSDSPVFSLFEDSNTVEKTMNRLPHLFWLAMIDAHVQEKLECR